MAVIWMGGEDIDFPNGGVVTNNTWNRSGFSRASVNCQIVGNACKSTLFPGGAITSGWLSLVVAGNASNCCVAGLGQSGTNSALCLIVNSSGYYGIGYTTNGGTNYTSLATSTFSRSTSPTKIDIQLINYGSSSTVTVYAAGVQILSYSGSTAISGVTGFDSVFLLGPGSGVSVGVSEIIVADEETLSFQGLVTMAPNSNGTTQQWSNPAYTNINPTTINDANATYVNATGDDEQVGLTALPSGSFAVKAVKTIARAMATAGAASTNLEVGFKNGSGTVAVGSSHALGTAFAPVEDYFTTDPTTGAAWGSLSGYDLDLRSA